MKNQRLLRIIIIASALVYLYGTTYGAVLFISYGYSFFAAVELGFMATTISVGMVILPLLVLVGLGYLMVDCVAPIIKHALHEGGDRGD